MHKAKSKGQKRRSGGTYVSEEDHVATLEEVVDRTLRRLRNLGNQVFALSPFSEHFGRWLVDLRVVLSEFESSPIVSVDDQFLKERLQILSNVELELEKRRSEEASCDEAIKSLSANRIVLERIEEECTSKTRNVERKKEVEVKRLSSNVDGLREELDRIARMKTGIFRGVSKRAKARKETEATQKLNSAQKELDSAEQNFAAEQERLRDEYEKRKQPVIEQIRVEEKEVENQDVDGSLETRQAACEALVNAVNALAERKSQLV
ncbi:MAG TPA: hypothetical protein VMT42_02280 [candidate division Zixibacteria bacterium]|nr:hypothetical protein [candidate division Zixibacteria bacterium]